MTRQPLQRVFRGPSIDLHYVEWPAGDAAVTVLLVHANGFHGRCWDQCVAELPVDYRCVAVDMRGHGRSDKKGPYTWDRFSQDLAELVDHLQLAGAVGVGHSMGGHCVAFAASLRPSAFSRLLLVDPVILPPEVYRQLNRSGFSSAEEHPVSRRRNRWNSWQEMVERFSSRHPFSLWHTQVLEDYCRHGLLPDPEGDGWVLACPPLVEASIYTGSSTPDAGEEIYRRIGQIDCPTTILRAPPREFGEAQAMDFSASPTWEELASRFANGRDVLLEELTHFIPMQAPDLVAQFISGQR